MYYNEPNYLKIKHFDELFNFCLEKESSHLTKERLSSKAMKYYNNNECYIMYINTMVFSYYDNECTINSNGWETMTTKKHINHGFEHIGSRVFVFQKNFKWFLTSHGLDKTWDVKINFQDKMTLSQNTLFDEQTSIIK